MCKLTSQFYLVGRLNGWVIEWWRVLMQQGRTHFSSSEDIKWRWWHTDAINYLYTWVKERVIFYLWYNGKLNPSWKKNRPICFRFFITCVSLLMLLNLFKQVLKCTPLAKLTNCLSCQTVSFQQLQRVLLLVHLKRRRFHMFYNTSALVTMFSSADYKTTCFFYDIKFRPKKKKYM